MRKAYLAIICLFTGFNAFAQHTDIQPVPQQISESINSRETRKPTPMQYNN